MTKRIKKYIAQFGEAACKFAVEVGQSGEGSCEIHYQVCKKFGIEYKPNPRNRYLIGDGLYDAGKLLIAQNS